MVARRVDTTPAFPTSNSAKAANGGQVQKIGVPSCLAVHEISESQISE